MSNILSPRARDILSQSLPLVRRHKEELIEQMERSLRINGVADARVSQGISSLLVELLLDEAHNLVANGMPQLERSGDDCLLPGIEGRHCSRFGDALVPALSDLLGPNLPREVPAAWCDAFWAIMRERDTAGPARRAFA